jgi:hypothetical protein
MARPGGWWAAKAAVAGWVLLSAGAVLAGPVEDAVRVELLRHVPGFWRIDKVTAEPVFGGRARFEARLKLDTDTYLADGRAGPVTFVRKGASSGTEKVVFGTVAELKAGTGKAFRVDAAGIADLLEPLGKPMDALPGRPVLAEGEEGKAARAAAEAEDAKRLEAEKARAARQAAADTATAAADEAERKAVEARSRRLSAFTDKLASRDAAERIAAFETALAGEDAALRRLAVTTALQGRDPVLASMALRDRLVRHKTVPVQLFATREDRNSETVLANLGPLILTVDAVDAATGNLTGSMGAAGYGVTQTSSAAGTVTAGELIVNTYGCSLLLRLTDGRSLDGLYRCQTLPVLAARVALD